jgi:hypothetical protein
VGERGSKRRKEKIPKRKTVEAIGEVKEEEIGSEIGGVRM